MELSSQVTSHTCFSLIFFAADTIECRLPFHGCTYNSESLASYCQGQLLLRLSLDFCGKKNRSDTHDPAKMSILRRHKLTNCGRIGRGYFLTNLPTERLHGSLACLFFFPPPHDPPNQMPRRWQRIGNAPLSLYLGLTCLLHRLESLLKVKVCHLMYAANSHRS